jgi:GNAT superfamily N-acetyltransferase
VANDVSITAVRVVDLPLLLPMLRAYCDFYEVEPRDDRLVALCRALIDDPQEGQQLLARRLGAEGEVGEPVGFATIFWTWQTLDAARVGVMNDLYVVAEARGEGVGRRLIEHCRGLCRKRGAGKLVWETAPDNRAAQRLYDSIGAESSTWLAYEIEAW